MSDKNLVVDITESGDDAGKVARVVVELACSYLKDGGGPTITADCGSLHEFELEIARLKGECDAALAEVADSFGGAGGPAAPSRGTRSSGERAAAPIDTALRVEDRMTRDVRTMRRNDKLSLADELMKVGRFRHVVVLEDDGSEVAGIISQRDIFYGALAWSTGQGSEAHRKSLETELAKGVMHADVTTVEPDLPLVEAAKIMLEKKIGCLPVVVNQDLVGILTEGDFLSLLTEAADRD
jgi:CBS domain-containing membrane protein